MNALHNTTIKGYELHDRIGMGGFGEVYRASQASVGREVAIKIILPSHANQPDFIRRFEGEAQLVARLEHPHIAPLYDYWRDPQGAYLVMRWLRGGSLHDALKSGAFELRAAALLLDQIAAALSLAHRNGVIHRDIKPANILLDEDSNAYLTDFGIAKDLNFEGTNTQGDAIVGSLDYISPEQARSQPVTARTDIYSLGVTMYEVITGHHPFQNISPIERLYKHINDPLPDLTEFDTPQREALNAVIHKATAKDPALRYPDALAFAAEFREAIGMNRSSTTLIELLTQREHDILHLLIEGLSNKEIAQRLTFTLGTVKWYVNQIYTKMGVRSRVQAIVRARELNLIGKGNETASPDSIATENFFPENPYKGLRAFQAADSMDFFGRERTTAKLISRLSEKDGRFLAVVGPSGSGKSSLVKAGLIPAIWRGDIPGSETWFVVEMLPGSRPLDELEIALTKVAAQQSINLHEQLQRDEFGVVRVAQLVLPEDGSQLLLVIDQFEEVFTLLEDEVARVHFLNLLVGAVTDSRSRVRIVVTLRADFYDRPLHYPTFGELLHPRLETIMPLSADELERAISQPATQMGLTFEPGLVARIVGDVNYQPGALPLLQYALTELFEQRQGRLLTREAYHAMGGTTGALAKRAELTFKEMDADAQHLTQQIFLRLVTLGEGVEDTRRRTSRAELLAISPNAEAVEDILDTFASYRLLALDNDPSSRVPTVEVAHEALLREWERLRGWLNISRDDIKIQRQLSGMANEWEQAKRDSSYLASGTRLEQFESWAETAHLSLTPLERNYLQDSINERERLNLSDKQRKEREATLERRSQTFLRGLVAVLIVAVLGAFGLTAVAANSATQAEHQALIAQQERERAEAQTRLAQARELVGYSKDALETDGELATLLALQAVNMTLTTDRLVLPEAETVLHQGVQKLKSPIRVKSATFPSGDWPVVLFTPDSTKIIYPIIFSTNFENGIAGVTDANTGELLYTLKGDSFGGGVYNNKLLTGDSTQAFYWDIASLDNPVQLLASAMPYPISLDTMNWIDVSLDFRYLVITENTTPNAANRIWDLQTEQEITTKSDPILPRGQGRPVFSVDATRLAIVDNNAAISIFDTATWQEIQRITIPNQGLELFLLSYDATLIFTLSSNNVITAWEIASGKELFALELEDKPYRMALSDDVTRMATATGTGETIIWNLVSQQEMFRISTGRLNGLAISPDLSRLATLHSRGETLIWNLAPESEVITVVNSDPDPQARPFGIAYNPDGTRLVVASMTATPIVWNAITGQKLFTLQGHTDRVLTTAWSEDGTRIATGGDDSQVMLWDATTGSDLMTLSGHTDSVYVVAFSPDSTKLASSSLDGTIRIWDVATGELLHILQQPAASKGVAWSPNGTRIVAGTDKVGGAGHLITWDVVTGEQVLDFAIKNARVTTVAYSPDGSRIINGLNDVHHAQVRDAQTGDILFALTNHTNIIPGVAYSPDGLYMATGSFDGTIRVWDATTGQEKLVLYGPVEGIGRVTFSPDGKHIATQNVDGTTRIYLVNIEDLIALANSRLTRTLTDAECQRYLHLEACPAQ